MYILKSIQEDKLPAGKSHMTLTYFFGSWEFHKYEHCFRALVVFSKPTLLGYTFTNTWLPPGWPGAPWGFLLCFPYCVAHTSVPVCVFLCLFLCKYLSICVCVSVCLCICMYVCMFLCGRLCEYLSVSVSVSVCMCMGVIYQSVCVWVCIPLSTEEFLHKHE